MLSFFAVLAVCLSVSTEAGLTRRASMGLLGSPLRPQIRRGVEVQGSGASAGPRPVHMGSHGVVTHTFDFGGRVTDSLWLNDHTLLVVAGKRLFGSRDQGLKWEQWSAGIKELEAEGRGLVERVFAQTDGVATEARLSAAEREARGFQIAVVTRGRTFIVDTRVDLVGVVAELRVQGSPALGRVSGAPASGPVQLDLLLFHPTKFATTALALLVDPRCGELQVQLCEMFLFLVDVATGQLSFVDVPHPMSALWGNPYPPLAANFSMPPAERPPRDFETHRTKQYDPDVFFVVSRASPTAPLDARLLRVSSRTASTSVVQGNAIAAASISGFEFVAGTVRRDGTLSATLSLSEDNFATVRPAQFPLPLRRRRSRQTAFEVVDAQEDVFVNVYHGSQWQQVSHGDTFMSGQHGLRYTLSLPRNRRQFSTDADGNNAVDFHRVQGLDGTIIANQLAPRATGRCLRCSRAADCDRLCEFRTVLSRDNGKTWEPVPAPQPACVGCHLHLHGAASDNRAVHPIRSSVHAPGLLLATGNIGQSLNAGTTGAVDAAVFSSSDGGASWRKIADEPHAYGETDYGGVIFLAHKGRRTRHLNFTTDAGRRWRSAEFAPGGVDVVEVLRPPHTPRSRSVLVFGLSSAGAVRVHHVDLSGAKEDVCSGLAAPDAPGSDFETWAPASYFSEASGGPRCLLGRTLRFTRRREGKDCWVAPPRGVEYALPVSAESCACAMDDYECDFGFAVERGGKCAVMDHVAETAEHLCAPGRNQVGLRRAGGQEYEQTKGYRRMAGDRCVGGLDLNPVRRPCPRAAGGGGAGSSVAALLVLLLVAIGVVVYVTPARGKVVEVVSTALTAIQGQRGYVAVELHDLSDVSDDNSGSDGAGEEAVSHAEPIDATELEAVEPAPFHPPPSLAATTTVTTSSLLSADNS